MAAVMAFDQRTRWIIGIPRLMAEIAQHIFILHIYFVGTWSKHAEILALRSCVSGGSLLETRGRIARMAQGISLANKCQILFGAAVFALLGAALSVPWIRTSSIVTASQLEVSRQLADTWFESGFSIGRSEGSPIPMRVIRVDEILFDLDGNFVARNQLTVVRNDDSRRSHLPRPRKRHRCRYCRRSSRSVVRDDVLGAGCWLGK